MALIVTEHIIRAVVGTIPGIDLNPSNLGVKPKFHWGDEKELNRYVQLKKDNSYPLIWLLPSPDNFEGGGQHATKSCTFVIATRETDESLYNDQRYIKTFDLVLNPLTDYLIQGLTKSTLTDVITRDWTITKFPRYSADSDENGTIDIWDAVRLEIQVRFIDGNINCLKDISYA